MKVVEALAHYLQSRGLFSADDFAELRRRGFLETIASSESRNDPPDPWWSNFEGEAHRHSTGDEPGAAARSRGGARPRRSAAGLPDLEAPLRDLLGDLETGMARLKPLAADLAFPPDPSAWSRLFQDVAGERLTASLRDTLAHETLKFDDLWRVVSEDSWHAVHPPEGAGGAVWSAWRVLLSSPDGGIPTAYRWILRSSVVRRVFHRLQAQRTLVGALATLFRNEPDVLWRAVTRPYHPAGFLVFSLAYTAAVNTVRGTPIRAVFQTDLPTGRFFAVGADDRLAVPSAAGGVRMFPSGGHPISALEDAPSVVEALAFHPAGDRLYVSRTGEAGVNRVLEVNLASGAERSLLQAYSPPQGPVCLELDNSLVGYRPRGAPGFRFFRRDVPGSCGFIASPHPIHADGFDFLPGGRYFGAVVSRTPTLRQYRIWNWSDGILARMFELGPDPPRHRAVRAFNRKHRLMAYCTGASSDIYDTHELNLLASHRHDPLAESASFNAVFSPDGRWLVKWSVTGEVLAWDWNSAAAPLTLEASDVDKALVGMAIDGNFAAGFRQSAQKIEIWNLPTGQLYSSESCAQFSADHTGLWTTAGKLGLLRWTERHTTGQVTRERPASPLKELILEVWSRFPDGARTTAHLWEGVRDEFMDATLFPDRETVVLRCRLHEHAVELFEFSLPEKAFTSRRVLSVPSFHPVAGQLEDLDIGMGRQLGFYDPLTGAKRDDWCIQAHTRPATSLKVSSGGGVLVACCDGQSLVVVDLASRTQSAEALLPTAPGPHRVLAVGDDATGQATVLLASGDVLKSVAVRDAGGATCTERELPRSGDAGRTTYWTACPGPAAPHAAFGTWGQLELLENPYSKAGPLFLHSKDGFGDWIPAFSPCGGFLSAARRNEFRMWTIDGAALHRRLFSIPQPFAVQYSPEGHTVWIADDDGTFWRIAVDALQPPANARVPAWELPRPEVLMQAWTLAQRVGSIDAGDWLPLLAAVCTAPVLSRFTYSDLGLLAPSIYV